MTFKTLIPKNRKKTSPGEILVKEFMEPMKMDREELSRKMCIPGYHVNGMIDGKQKIKKELAILLSRVFKTTPEFWMNL